MSPLDYIPFIHSSPCSLFPVPSKGAVFTPWYEDGFSDVLGDLVGDYTGLLSNSPLNATYPVRLSITSRDFVEWGEVGRVTYDR
jgi:hypothetical protein